MLEVEAALEVGAEEEDSEEGAFEQLVMLRFVSEGSVGVACCWCRLPVCTRIIFAREGPDKCKTVTGDVENMLALASFATSRNNIARLASIIRHYSLPATRALITWKPIGTT